MKKNDKVLLLRYSDFHGVNTIQEHINTLEKNGFCWWAKLGKQPSEKYLKDFCNQEEPTILLYTPTVLHICDFGGVITERPQTGYPNYYLTDIFGKENEPHIYFKLNSIKKIDVNFLADYIVTSSEKEALYDLKKTISSYMFLQHKDAPRKPKRQKQEKKKEKIVLDKHSCTYRKAGMCDNKRCINYQYECLHPEICIKQKIK